MGQWFALPVVDAEDVDNEKRDNIQADAAGLHRFYSKHMDFPDSKELLSLFSQVKTFNKKKSP